ncbi:MAG: S-layer homology domain-containing protein [Clostridia bacterium]|nr:S-layer homology domain-containing protein [Clostridia bacterium]
MKSRLTKCIVSIILSAFVFAQTVVVFANDAQAQKIVTSYEASTKTFSVSGAIPAAKRKFVAVIIAPQDTAIESAIDLANREVVLKTVQIDTQGKFDFEIILPDYADKARYKYFVFANGETKYSMFSTAKEEAVSSYLSGVNGGGINEAKAFVANSATGLDDGKTKNKEFIASYILAVKPEVGYTAEELINAYLTGEGLSYVKSGNMTTGKFLEKYCHYLDKDYLSEYEKLPLKTQAALTEAFKNNAIAKDFDTTYNNNLFVAEYVTANNATALRDVVLAYFEANDISLDAYDEIDNDVYQEKVFDELYKSCSSQKLLADILDAFAEEVENQQDAADSVGGSGSSGGGGGSSSSGKGGFGADSAVTVKPSSDSAAPTAVFKDINTHWAKSYVESMHKKGIINGFTDGTFKPDLNVTRAEFAKMIAQILALDTTGDSDFSDIADNSWYNGYVAAVAKAGIVMGTDGKFMPDKNITRQDAAVMLARVLEYKGKTYNSESFGFGDEAKIAEYAKGAVNGMAHLGLITGYNGEFAPTDNTTRGQAAALLARACDYIQ